MSTGGYTLLVRRIGAGEVLQEVGEAVGPGVEPLVHPEDEVPLVEQAQGEVGADLPARAGYEYAHVSVP
jgi:hypothetical protein